MQRFLWEIRKLSVLIDILTIMMCLIAVNGQKHLIFYHAGIAAFKTVCVLFFSEFRFYFQPKGKFL